MLREAERARYLPNDRSVDAMLDYPWIIRAGAVARGALVVLASDSDALSDRESLFWISTISTISTRGTSVAFAITRTRVRTS